MSGQHAAPRRARIVLYDVAREQAARMAEPELRRLDTALDFLAQYPDSGTPMKQGPVRELRHAGARVLYVPTVLGTLVLVAYVEA